MPGMLFQVTPFCRVLSPVYLELSIANPSRLSTSLPYVRGPTSLSESSITLIPLSWLTAITQDGSDFMGERLTVQFARGSRHREQGGGYNHDRNSAPRPRRTPHRMQITGLPNDTSWQVCLSSSTSFPADSVWIHPLKALELAIPLASLWTSQSPLRFGFSVWT